MTEPGLQEFGQIQEVLERLRAGDELNEKIDVAVRARIAPGYGTEEGETTHAESPDLRLGGEEALHGLLSGQCSRVHSGQRSPEAVIRQRAEQHPRPASRRPSSPPWGPSLRQFPKGLVVRIQQSVGDGNHAVSLG